MKVSDSAKALLKAGRERRRLLALGYRPHETDPEITRGRRRDEIIVGAIISADGKHVYTKIGKPDRASTSADGSVAETSKPSNLALHARGN